MNGLDLQDYLVSLLDEIIYLKLITGQKSWMKLDVSNNLSAKYSSTVYSISALD